MVIITKLFLHGKNFMIIRSVAVNLVAKFVTSRVNVKVSFHEQPFRAWAPAGPARLSTSSIDVVHGCHINIRRQQLTSSVKHSVRRQHLTR
jgi:hypothetical protein